MIRELLIEVMNRYSAEKQKPFKKNELAALIRRDLRNAITEKSSLTNQYKIKGSAGAGRWAEIPWVAILDRDITKTPEREFYIVYLFDAEMNGIYLSLNQGWTQYEKEYGNNQPAARKAIQERTLYLQKFLGSAFDFSKLPLDLHAKNNLGRGYQLGNICGKFYPKNQIPDDVHLIDDLRNMVGVYRELKGRIGVHILDFGMPQIENSSIEEVDIPFTSEIEIKELKLKAIQPSQKSKNKSNRPILFDEEKNLLNQKKNKKIGDSGEKLVLEAEKNRLINENRSDLAERVKCVSEDMNLGYDILSFEANGLEKQIEVKSSTSNDAYAFFLTANELERSKTLNNYYLFVVQGVGTSRPSIRFFHAPKFLSEFFDLQPRQYFVRYQPLDSAE